MILAQGESKDYNASTFSGFCIILREVQDAPPSPQVFKNNLNCWAFSPVFKEYKALHLEYRSLIVFAQNNMQHEGNSN